MEILNDKSAITTYVPRIIETTDHLIVNAQVYDKVTFKPIPFEFKIEYTGLLFSIFSRCIWTYNNDGAAVTMFLHNANSKGQKLFQDTTDPDIFYLLMKYESYGIRFVKFKKEKNNVSVVNTFTHNHTSGGSVCTNNGYAYGNDIDILYQSDLYIVYVLKYTYAYDQWWWGGEYYYLRKYNKKTHEVQDFHAYAMGVKNCAISNYQFMEYYNDNVYLYRQAGNSHYIYKLNLSTNLITTLFSYTNTNGVTIIDNPVKIGDYYYLIRDNYSQSGVHEYCFYKLKLDVTTDEVVQEIIDLDLNGYTLDTADGQVLSGIGEGIYFTLKPIQTDDKNYIVCTIHAIPNINYYPNQHKNIVFEVTDTNVVVKDMIRFPNGCKGVLEYINPNTLVFLYTDGIGFYKFDQTSEKYILTYRKPGIFNTIGFDTLNRFYMQYNTNAIEVMTSMNACVLKADFTDEYYTNINTDTNIHFYAKNFLDEFLNTDVRITLVGPVQFKDGTRQIITKTSDKGIETLPVKITGSGRIEVVITQLTEN